MAEASPKRRKIAGLGEIPNPRDNVFLPISDAPDLSGHKVTFLRASPETGKSTFGRNLGEKEGKVYLQLSLTASPESAVVAAINKTLSSDVRGLDAALRELNKLQDGLLIIDEAHLMFGTDACSTILKSDVRTLLLSASGEGTQEGCVYLTPQEVSRKILWRPPLKVTDNEVQQFDSAGFKTNLQVLNFLANFCAHIKGVFMVAVHFLLTESVPCSSLSSLIMNLKHKQTSFYNHLKACRAVAIHGGFDVTEHEEFIQVLLKGPTKRIPVEVLRDLCIKGALLPVCTSKEFTSYAWDDRTTQWGVSNHLMAEYYVGILKDRGYKISWPTEVSSGSDLIVRALPSIGFRKVVQQPIFGEDENGKEKLIHNLSSTTGFPHEDHYNDALYSFLEQFYSVSRQKGSRAGMGNPDLTVSIPGDSCIVIETVLWKNDIGEHRKRFDALEAYRLSKFQCLLIIGPDEDTVQQKVTNTNGGKVEIVGVVVTHSHHEYRVFVKQAGPGSLVEGPFVIPCDCVARSLMPNTGGMLQLRCCQDYKPPKAAAGTLSIRVREKSSAAAVDAGAAAIPFKRVALSGEALTFQALESNICSKFSASRGPDGQPVGLRQLVSLVRIKDNLEIGDDDDTTLIEDGDEFEAMFVGSTKTS
mmetsp:Transcript_79628/g.174611  ORF Transcript_79628/g.174611 Transcript_79628/m.174611 type:complete len:642 (+) Transcript_79628:69-1994(+)